MYLERSGKNLVNERGTFYRIHDQGTPLVLQVKSWSGCYADFRKLLNTTGKICDRNFKRSGYYAETTVIERITY